MLEAKLVEGQIFKKVVDALKELVNESNFDCNASGITLQAMDTTHVALATLLLRSDGFESYRCDRNIPLGINLTSLTKILKSANPSDSFTFKAEDSGDSLGLVFESPGMSVMPAAALFPSPIAMLGVVSCSMPRLWPTLDFSLFACR